MPHIEIKCSNDIELAYEVIFRELETRINQFDPSCGDCKSRFYPAAHYYHSHVKVDAWFLEKANRGGSYVQSMLKLIKQVIEPHLPKGVWLSIEFHFSQYYTTERL